MIPTPYSRLKRLVKILASPHNELIGPFWIGEHYIDTIEITYNDDIIFHFFEADIDKETPAIIVGDKNLLELVEQLEKILLN